MGGPWGVFGRIRVVPGDRCFCRRQLRHVHFLLQRCFCNLLRDRLGTRRVARGERGVAFSARRVDPVDKAEASGGVIKGKQASLEISK